MKRLFLYLSLSLFCIASACKKLDVDPEDGTPVFSAQFSVDGMPVDLEGGVNDYYMYTSFQKDNNDVLSFIGELKKENCDSNCNGAIEIQIRDFQSVPPNSLNIDEALKPGIRFFRAPVEIQDSMWNQISLGTDYLVDFYADTSFVTSSNMQFRWQLPGGNSSSGLNASVLLDTLSPAPEVTLSSTVYDGSDSCTITQTQYLQISEQERCEISISPVFSDFQLENLQANPGGNMSQLWQWAGPASTSVDSLLNDSLLSSEPDYFAELFLTGACEARASFKNSNVFSQQVLQSCYARFGYEVTEVPVVDSVLIYEPGDSLQYRKVTIIYTDEFGDRYVSDNEMQSGISNFEILNVEDFDDNENGFPTKKIILRFSCTVWNETTGESKLIESISDVVFGVAYPN